VPGRYRTGRYGHQIWRLVSANEPQLADAGDEPVFEAAVNGRADALVTYNTRHFVAASVRFGLRIVRPVEVLEEMTR
jgi:predicted nucleic acid-binding protein